MRLICKLKGSVKRVLVDTGLEPDYKKLYNDEFGNPFTVDVNQCSNCDKGYKTKKGLEKHLEKCD